MKRTVNAALRLASLALSLLMLLSLAVGCAEEGEAEGTTAGPGTDAPTTEAETLPEGPTEDDELTAIEVLGQKNLGGETFTFFVRKGGNMWDIDSLYATEILSDTINDAVYTRNTTLEEQYKFEIDIIESGATTYSNRVGEQILSGEHEFDVLTACGYDMASLAVMGVLRDVNRVEGFQFDKPWWNTTLNEQLTVKDALYYFSGDLICEDNMALRVIFFNKTMADSVGASPDSLYNLAKTGKWTMEEMFTIAKRAYLNLDDTPGKSEGDRLGFVAQEVVAGYVFLTSADIPLSYKDETDTPLMNTSFDYNVVDAISSYFTRDDAALVTSDALTPYKNNRALFMAEVLGSIIKIRDWDIKTGILPSPKYEETQERYNQFADGNCINLLAIPTGKNHRLEKTVFVLEAMSIESTSTLNPAFYDTCLRGRYSYDPESAAMLDIILDSFFIDNVNLYKRAWGDFQDDIVADMLAGGGLADTVASYRDTLPAKIAETVQKLVDIKLAQGY